ncbi:MAG: hypothetical protein QNJ12_17940 [Ilumatobacter sp.]|uniref:hypothetical protein n=1 Tax=Ilumatobacter sp. TaxID=1967498 RepID=UPI0026040C2D|nr:hypothetical protein [Ilumatobacter sp.]MDJ0770680.1 hypothetical protein [Ilumatobacter sp.]
MESMTTMITEQALHPAVIVPTLAGSAIVFGGLAARVLERFEDRGLRRRSTRTH